VRRHLTPLKSKLLTELIARAKVHALAETAKWFQKWQALDLLLRLLQMLLLYNSTKMNLNEERKLITSPFSEPPEIYTILNIFKKYLIPSKT